MKAPSESKQEPKPPRDYFSRPEQYRLLLLVFSLMLVVVLIFETAKPKNWEWMFGTPETTVPTPPIDTRRPTPNNPSPLPEGTFLSPRSDLDLPTAPTNLDDRWLLPIDAYRDVEDNTVFRAADHPIWFELIRQLRSSSPDQLQSLSMGEVGFVQLFDQPDQFRGRVLEIRGDVRRAHYLAAPNNDFGIRGYWQCWLFPPRNENPIVVYALELPQGFPSGMKMLERVRFTGVFFKRWAYPSSSGTRVAPLVVAASGEWNKPKTKIRQLPNLKTTLAAIAGVMFVGLLTCWWVYRNSLRIAANARDGSSAEILLSSDQQQQVELTGTYLSGLENDDET